MIGGREGACDSICIFPLGIKCERCRDAVDG